MSRSPKSTIANPEGVGITFPALAILFSKTMDAFQTINVSQGNFYSLMFFVVALGNLLAYAVTGWTSNLIGQVRQRI
jgi:ATP-binding cassette subfamily B (MDR/TAP) protein 1